MSKTRFSFSALILSSCVATFALGACSPNAIPDGYVYHDKPYKSANPPKSSKFSEVQRASMGAAQADQFRLAIYDLVDKLTMRAGMPPKAVFVDKPKPMTAFYSNLDNDLRESLRHVGYRLADSPEDAYVMSYAVEPIKREKGAPPVQPGSPNMRISLFVSDSLGEEARVLTHEIGDYYIQGGEDLNIPFHSFYGRE